MYRPGYVIENNILGYDMFSISSSFYSVVKRPSGTMESIYNKVHRVAYEQRNTWLATRDLETQMLKISNRKIKFNHDDNEYKKSVLTPGKLFTSPIFLFYFLLFSILTICIPCFFWVGPLVGLLIGRNKVWKRTKEYKDLIEKKTRELSAENNRSLNAAQVNLKNCQARVIEAIKDLDTISPQEWQRFIDYSEHQIKKNKYGEY